MLAFITAALHRSRRIQARQILRRHAHLIAPSFPQPSGRNSGSEDIMPTDYRPAKAKQATETTRQEMGWLAAIAAAFMVVHIVAWTVGTHASAQETKATVTEAISPLCD